MEPPGLVNEDAGRHIATGIEMSAKLHPFVYDIVSRFAQSLPIFLQAGSSHVSQTV
jgi:hypothetical protein